MEKKMLWLWALVALLSIAYLSASIPMGVEANKADPPIWQGYHNEDKLTYPLSSAHQLSMLVEWNRTYGGADWDVLYSVEQTSDGGYIAAGYAESFGNDDCWLVKTDAHGEVEWNKTYGGSQLDGANAVQQTDDGGYILAGMHEVGLLDFDILLIKTDAYGEAEWNKTYGGSSVERAYSVQQTSDGGYIVVGSADSFKTGIFDGEIWVVKTDEYGWAEWSWFSGWPDWDLAYSVQQTSEGGYIIGGTRFSSYQTRFDFWLIKLDSNGTYMWDDVYARPGSRDDVVECVRQTVDGGYIITGGRSDFWLVKTDEYGGVEWNRTFGGPQDEIAYSVHQTDDRGFIVAGKTESFGLGQNGYPDGWLVKFFPTHDVAAYGIEPSKAVVGENYPLSVNVTVCNPGFFTESFNVTVYVNSTDVGTQIMYDLGPEASASLVFMLNASGFTLGNYTLSAYAEPVLNETKTSDNLFVGGQLFITIPGDVDADCDVDIFDIVAMAGAYGSEEGDPAYNPVYDIEDDGDVDIFDIVIACINYGENWS